MILINQKLLTIRNKLNSYRDSRLTDQSLNLNYEPSPLKNLLEIITHYETPKVIRFESKWIASLSLFVKLTLAIGCIYLMCQRTSYQVFDRSPISAVTIEVTPSYYCSENSSIMEYFPDYNCNESVYDVNDFILPATENSAVSITTRMTQIEHILRACHNETKRKKQSNYSSINLTSINATSINLTSINATSRHNCYVPSRCILPPFYRKGYENETTEGKSRLCWFKLSNQTTKRNYEALDYILLVKNFVEFPQLKVVRTNLAANIIPKNDTNVCEYDLDKHKFCPRFRILKILKSIVNDTNEYKSMFFNGSLIEIKISWKCNLDKHLHNCKPNYEFKRLDFEPYHANPYEPGSNFMTSRHFFRPDDKQLHRVHTTIYNLHIIVSVTGEVGIFDLFQTTTSIGSFLGIIGTGTIVCDLIAAFFTNFKRVKYDSR